MEVFSKSARQQMLELPCSQLFNRLWINGVEGNQLHTKRSTLGNKSEYSLPSHVEAETLKQSPPIPLTGGIVTGSASTAVPTRCSSL